MEIETSGFVATVAHITIDGVGVTEEEAIAEVIADCGPWEIEDDETGQTRSMTREEVRSRIHTYRATQALMTQVEAEGGAISWGEVNGIACTIQEEETSTAHLKE